MLVSFMEAQQVARVVGAKRHGLCQRSQHVWPEMTDVVVMSQKTGTILSARLSLCLMAPISIPLPRKSAA
jgi:hypothetical protein